MIHNLYYSNWILKIKKNIYNNSFLINLNPYNFYIFQQDYHPSGVILEVNFSKSNENIDFFRQHNVKIFFWLILVVEKYKLVENSMFESGLKFLEIALWLWCDVRWDNCTNMIYRFFKFNTHIRSTNLSEEWTIPVVRIQHTQLFIS